MRIPFVLGLLLLGLAACDDGGREPFASAGRDAGPILRRDSGVHPDAGEGLDAELGADVDQPRCLQEYFDCRAARVAVECSDAGEQAFECTHLQDRRCVALRCADPTCVGGCGESECASGCRQALNDRLQACTAQCEPESQWPTACTAECVRVREEQIIACDADPCAALGPIVHDPLQPPILDAG